MRCQVACPVREAASGKRTGRKTGTAPRADFTTLAALGLTPEQLSPDNRAAYEQIKAHDDRIAAILAANGRRKR